MIRHDLQLVREHLLDGTFHCEVHGLLSPAETADCFQRAGISHGQAAATQDRWGFVARVVDVLVRLVRRPHCVETA